MPQDSVPLHPPLVFTLKEVRYPLPLLLEEIRLEKEVSSFVMEKLDQQEIAKLFKSKTPRRAKPKN